MASIRAKGSNFEVRVMVNGRSISRTLRTHEEAQRWAAGVQYGFIAPTVRNSPTTAIPTLGQACQRYLIEVVPSHKGARQEKNRLQSIQLLPMAEKHLNKITPQHLKSYRDALQASGLSSDTVRLNLALLSSVFRYAREEWGIVVDNPVLQVKKPKPGKNRNRRLSPEEEVRLMAALTECRNPQVARIIQFFLETGMRKSEALGLTWDHIDLEKHLVTLQETKNGHPRWIPLTPTAHNLLTTAPAKNGPAFPISESALSQAWAHAIKRAGIIDLRIHDLRHEALSRWAHRLKGDVFKLALISGHRTLQMAQRYVHPVKSELLVAEYIG